MKSPSELIYEHLIRDFNIRHGFSEEDVLFITMLKEGGLNNKQIALVINAMEETCDYCRNNNFRCYCMRDD